MGATNLVYRRTLTIPEFKAETGSAKINLHQTAEGKVFFSTDKLHDDCKVSSKLSVIDIQAEAARLVVSEVFDPVSEKVFFMMHLPKSNALPEAIFTL